MACSLQACFGASLIPTKARCAKIVLIAKLGGNTLGDAEPKQDHEDQKAFLHRLGYRISKLMPHGAGLPPKFINVELVGNNALAFWDEAEAKRKYFNKHGTSSNPNGVFEVWVDSMCVKVGKLVNLFRNEQTVMVYGDHLYHKVDIQHVLFFPALKELRLRILSVGLDLLPSTVETLELHKVGIQGGNLSRRLKRLVAFESQVSADWVAQLCECKHLVEVEFLRCVQTQPARLLPQLGGLANLKVMILIDCFLVGSVPTELGAIDLEELCLNDNQLTGPIPSELGRCRHLALLRLHNNQLSGRIPTELGQATSLIELWLHGNKLTGSFPSEIGLIETLKFDGNIVVHPDQE